MKHLHHCRAPAKLNLFLHVVGQREDGYHLLQSVFQLIDLADVLHFDLREDETIARVTEVPDVPASDDLIVRAAQLLGDDMAQRGRRPAGVNITIEKQIPMGGGLGGGSSDAATTLMALNHLWQAGMTRSELMALGLRLGADVPFFLLGENAFVEGIGEQLTAVPTPSVWFVVIHPGISVPTPVIFRAPELTRNTKAVKIADFSASPLGFGRNDLQAVAARAFPPVADAVEWLSGFGEARMTGSGACVFAAFASETEADAVLQSVPAAWRGWKARTLAAHPMLHLLQSSSRIRPGA
ncbi:MAG: 4-(cytidine 5'-diphospho)-2-C-methyl-D-erythritol kinase [Oxalobacteraceae bacterium]|jgi:4-diphosphocytidyl-2-C-methyl-D-erythritol kinase|nr:4-(cytidine 5'-diphospho)-2-C-methyl-D-erythritol kinase [Oxalobacteraceae bacterium]